MPSQRIAALLTVLVLACARASAQGGGDECAGAFVITDPADVCLDRGANTTAGATRSTAPEICSPGNNAPDVWYRFDATLPGLSIRLSSEQAGDVEGGQFALYSGTCGALQPVACGSNPSSSPRSSIVLTDARPGETYYVRVFGDGSGEGTFELCLRSFQPGPEPRSDCDVAQRLCGEPRGFSVAALQTGGLDTDEIPNGTCFGDNPPESQSVWYTFTAETTGFLEFTLTPANGGDLDFIVFELNAVTQCGGKSVLRCMASGDDPGLPGENCQGPTGLQRGAGDIAEGAGCDNGQDNFLEAVLLQAGRTYALFVNNYDLDGAGFSIDFDNTTAVFTGPDAGFAAVAGEASCTSQAFGFTADETATDASYSWDFGAGATPATSSSRQVDVTFTGAAGPRFVTLTVSTPECDLTTTQRIEYAPNDEFVAEAQSITPVTCDGPNSGAITVAVTTAGDYRYRLAGTTTANASGTFTGLPAGTVTIEVFPDGEERCARPFTFEIPDEADLGAAVDFTSTPLDINCGSSLYGFDGADVPGGTYSWNFGPDATPQTATGQQADATFTGPTGPRTVTLVVTRGNCSDSETKTVDVSTDADFAVDTVSTAPTTCDAPDGGRVALAVTEDGQPAPAGDFSFELGGVTNVTGVFEGLTAGNYTVSVRAVGTGPECARTFDFVIRDGSDLVDPAVAVVDDPDPCQRTTFTFGLTDPAVAGGTYAWDFGAGATPATATGPGPHAVTFSGDSGERTATVTVSQGPTCTASGEAVVDYVTDQPFTLTPELTLVSCDADDSGVIDVAVAPAGEYVFQLDGGAEQATGRFEGLTVGTYGVSVRRAGQPEVCATTETITLGDDGTVAPFFGAVTVTEASCLGVANGSVTFGNLPPGITATLLDSDRDPARAFDDLAGNAYRFRLEGEEGCTRDTNIVVPALPGPQLDLGPDLRVRFGDTILISPTFTPGRAGFDPDGLTFGGLDSTYVGLRSLGGLIFAPNRIPQQVVTATLTDDDGCVASDEVVVGVRIDQVFEVPTAFTPNDDEVNDVWYPRAGPSVRLFRRVQVFNRWGGLLFNFEDVPRDASAFAWDGRVDGQDMDSDTYVYLVEVEFVNGLTRVFSGTLNLLR